MEINQQLKEKSDILAHILVRTFDNTVVDGTGLDYEEWSAIREQKKELLSDLLYAFAKTIQDTQSGVIILDDE